MAVNTRTTVPGGRLGKQPVEVRVPLFEIAERQSEGHGFVVIEWVFLHKALDDRPFCLFYKQAKTLHAAIRFIAGRRAFVELRGKNEQYNTRNDERNTI